MQKIARVFVKGTAFHFDKPFDYAVPVHFNAQTGARAEVPFGKRNRTKSAFITEVYDGDTDGLKEIISITDDTPLLNDEMIKLAFYLKETTLCTGYDAFKILIPRTVSDASSKMCELIIKNFDNEKLTEKQKTAADFLYENGTMSIKELCYFTGVTEAVLKTMAKNGIVRIYNEPYLRSPYKFDDKPTKTKISLSFEQKKAYVGLKNELFSEKKQTSLLFGITGSGKTQVFLKLIDDCLDNGRNVIVMVPEIALTPQTLSIFGKRYDRIALFHSAMSAGQRMDEYKRVKSGEAKIVIGTRSAIFAPLSNIGLIIIDEEQEHTYKSESSPRFHTRDVAKFRAKYHDALLLLASATPSIETYSYAKSGKYKLFELQERYGNATLPLVNAVNMRSEMADGNFRPLSRDLIEHIREKLERKEQCILFINRRGFNIFISCRSCGHVMDCPNCSISLIYHKTNNKLMCHYCNYSEDYSHKCPKCGQDNIRYSGFGTQRIQEELKIFFENAKVLRVDADTTAARFSHENLLKSFKNHEYDIMIGTQMVAKGLDFQNVTLVGVINADQSLYSDDYRAAERTFSLLTQVVGRSGRGDKEGLAIIQTVTPEKEIIAQAASQDYISFYNTEIKMRKMLTYPPYCDLCVIGFMGEIKEKTQDSAKQLFESIKNLITGEYREVKIIILGPSPAAVPKVSNKYRFKLIIKCKNNQKFREMISKAVKGMKIGKTTLTIDFNPENIL